MHEKHWRQRTGVISTELVLVATVLTLGLIVGLKSVRDAVVTELADSAQSIANFDQSYSYSSIRGHGGGTEGSAFGDQLDFCDAPDAPEGPGSRCVNVCIPPGSEGDVGPGGGNGVEPRSQGYFSTHPEEFPVDELTLGNETFNASELLAILNQPVQGDVTIALAKQLIAAKFNVLRGVDGTAVASDIQAGDQFLIDNGGVGSGLPASDPAWQNGGEATKDALEAFNLGN